MVFHRKEKKMCNVKVGRKNAKKLLFPINFLVNDENRQTCFLPINRHFAPTCQSSTTLVNISKVAPHQDLPVAEKKINKCYRIGVQSVKKPPKKAHFCE
jgi:hypothetical protein